MTARHPPRSESTTIRVAACATERPRPRRSPRRHRYLRIGTSARPREPRPPAGRASARRRRPGRRPSEGCVAAQRSGDSVVPERVDELPLAHPRTAGDADLRRSPSQVGNRPLVVPRGLAATTSHRTPSRSRRRVGDARRLLLGAPLAAKRLIQLRVLDGRSWVSARHRQLLPVGRASRLPAGSERCHSTLRSAESRARSSARVPPGHRAFRHASDTVLTRFQDANRANP